MADPSMPFVGRPTTALRQPEWGAYVMRLERALRAQIAEVERLRRQLQSVDAELETTMPDTPTVDDLLAELDGWNGEDYPGELIEHAAAALRAQIAETERLRDAQPAWREMVNEHQRVEAIEAELAEARAAAPQPLVFGKTRPPGDPEKAPGSLVGVHYVAVPPGTEYAVYPRDQLPAGVTREQVRNALDPFFRAPLDLKAATDAVWALLTGEGSDDAG